jgi:hypothetical protein
VCAATQQTRTSKLDIYIYLYNIYIHCYTNMANNRSTFINPLTIWSVTPSGDMVSFVALTQRSKCKITSALQQRPCWFEPKPFRCNVHNMILTVRTCASHIISLIYVFTLWEFNIAIENGHLYWIYPLKIVMFHSYVSLPEGNMS